MSTPPGAQDVVAAARALSAPPGSASGPGLDVIVVDDQTAATRRWFDEVLGEHRLLSFADVPALHRFLDGQVPPHLSGMEPFDPAVAFVDLDLGPGQPTGLAAVRALATSHLARDLLIALRTNALHDHRDLLAVLCAEANGGGILRAGKDDEHDPQVAELVRWVAGNRRVGAPSNVAGSVAGLEHIRAVTVRSATSAQRTYPLGELLAGEGWKPRFWERLAQTRDYTASLLEALDMYDALRDAPRNRRENLARDTRNQNDFGLVPVALDAAGGRFTSLPDGVLDLGRSPDHRFGQMQRKEHIRRNEIAAVFADRYGSVLTREEARPAP